jgi:tRNA 5-methylaminomethyl-2-thiouridine biosynthesis bifunctional protein
MTEKIVEWQENNTPQSLLYGDIYYSTEDGLAESKAVFLDGIGAPDVWQGRSGFTICELGFGTGLNFLNTVKLWLETTDENQKLYYYATEKYPLLRVEIQRAISYPELANFRDHMIEQYPEPSVQYFDGRVSLNLLIGDSLTILSKADFKADAWFLDGFAPSKNPDMWSCSLFREIARLSAMDAKLTTFTAAGAVRRGLGEVGFQMVKRPGYGKKREMLKGDFTG